MALSLRDTFPIRIRVGNDDITPYVETGTFSNTDPGGFEACSLEVPRDLPQTIRGLPIRIETGLATAWEGRVSQIQRSLGAKTSIVGEGYGALIKDTAASMVFVDRDLTRFQDPSYTRQNTLISLNRQLASSQVAADPTSQTPAIVQAIQDSWATPWTPTNESWYDAGPENLIAKIYYNLAVAQAAIGTWQEFVGLSNDANASTFELSSNLDPSGSGYFTPATAYRFAFLQHLNTTTGVGTQGATYNAFWHQIATYGNHGLPGRGADPVGFYPSDIYGWLISQISGLQPGVIQTTDASGYVVPHAAYYTETSLDSIAADMATIQGWHWGVWASLAPLTGDPRPRADFRPRPAPGAFTAFCHRSACDTLDIREDLAQQFNRAVITFTDVAGVAGATVVTVDNPVLDAAGIATRTLVLNGGTMDPSTAAVYGLEALTLTNVQAKIAGSADIISAIDYPSGPQAPWLLSSGIDRLRIGDAPSTDAFGAQSDYPISRVECSLSTGGITTSVEFGTSGANLVETLQARLSAATALAGTGG